MASSVSGQDESNPALWFATRAGKMELLARWGLPAVSREKIFPKSRIINTIDHWSLFSHDDWILASFFFASLWISTPSGSLNLQKRERPTAV